MSITAIDDALLQEQGRFHSCLSDVPGKTAGEMKEFMDYIPRNVIIPKLNEVISGLDAKPDTEELYTAEQTDALLLNKADTESVYSKEDTDNLLLNKADKESVYSKEETDGLLSDKADANNVYTCGDVDWILATLVEGTAMGTTVEIDDLANIQEYFDVTLHSKNLVPYPYDYEQQTVNGITYTANSDGSITVNGTATASSTFTIYFKIGEYLPLGITPGEWYTISCGTDKDATGCTFTINYYNEEPKGLNYLAWLSVAAGGAEKTAVFPRDGLAVRMYVNVPSGTTVDNVTLYPMLERGAKATGFTPYIWDFSHVVVTVDSSVEQITYNSDCDGYPGIVSPFYPYMCLTSNDEGVFIICRYYRDINKAFNAVYKKVMMGG